jgi:hypothetical protein
MIEEFKSSNRGSNCRRLRTRDASRFRLLNRSSAKKKNKKNKRQSPPIKHLIEKQVLSFKFFFLVTKETYTLGLLQKKKNNKFLIQERKKEKNWSIDASCTSPINFLQLFVFF